MELALCDCLETSTRDLLPVKFNTVQGDSILLPLTTGHINNDPIANRQDEKPSKSKGFVPKRLWKTSKNILKSRASLLKMKTDFG